MLLLNMVRHINTPGNILDVIFTGNLFSVVTRQGVTIGYSYNLFEGRRTSMKNIKNTYLYLILIISFHFDISCIKSPCTCYPAKSLLLAGPRECQMTSKYCVNRIAWIRIKSISCKWLQQLVFRSWKKMFAYLTTK